MKCAQSCATRKRPRSGRSVAPRWRSHRLRTPKRSPQPFAARRAYSMVATADIGRVVADTLAQSWQGRRVIEIEGPQRYTQHEIAALLGRVLERDVKAQAVPRDQWEARFQAQGTAWPAPRIEMLDGFNSGWIDFEPGVNEHVVGNTAYETVLAELVKRAG